MENVLCVLFGRSDIRNAIDTEAQNSQQAQQTLRKEQASRIHGLRFALFKKIAPESDKTEAKFSGQ